MSKREIFLMAGVMLLALALVYSWADSDPSTTQLSTPQSSTEPPETQKPKALVIEETFLEVVREKGVNGTDDELLEMADTVCDLFDAGMSFQDFVNSALLELDEVDDAENFFYFVGASVGAFCPEHTEKIPGAGTGA